MKEDKEESEYEKYGMAFLKIMAIGFVVIVGYIYLESYFTSKEYPELMLNDLLENRMVYSVKTNRSASYVEFDNGKKYKLSWGQNYNYDEGFRSIAEFLSSGDMISKKVNSDTITIRHLNKNYLFSLGHMIRKSK